MSKLHHRRLETLLRLVECDGLLRDETTMSERVDITSLVAFGFARVEPIFEAGWIALATQEGRAAGWVHTK
jgi:hypothetical protein